MGELKDDFMNDKFFLKRFKPENAECSMVVIVGPYPTKKFVDKVKEELNPQKIFVVVDESWNPFEIEWIKKIIGQNNVKMVRTKTGLGIVHSKMYYVEYKKIDGKIASRLFTGSVNASMNSITNNSEFVDCFKLSSFKEETRKEIKNYFKNLISHKNAGSFRADLLTKSVDKELLLGSLFFPRIVPSGEQKSFYNWIRSGRFYVKYDRDPNFGCLTVSLNKDKLPPNKFDEKLKGSIFENDRSKSGLRYPYVGKKKDDNEKENERWKRYTVETCYGLWSSYECAKKKKLPYKIKGSGEIVKSISELEKTEIDSIVNEFVDEIEKLRKKDKILRNCIPKPPKDVLKRKIKNDISLAKDDEFVKRYTTGYSCIKPSFNNSSKLETISKDFVNSCLMKQNKIRIENLMAKKFKELFPEKDIDEIRKELLNHWEKYSNDLTNYFQEDG